jgi:hypothetical protein
LSRGWFQVQGSGFKVEMKLVAVIGFNEVTSNQIRRTAPRMQDTRLVQVLSAVMWMERLGPTILQVFLTCDKFVIDQISRETVMYKVTVGISVFTCLCFALISCNKLYKAGSLRSLDYPVETKLSADLIRRYTAMDSGEHSVPEKWSYLHKLDELDSVTNRRVYFKDDPEEMYLLSLQGMLVLVDVYNPKIRNDGGWIADRERLSKSEEERIKGRLNLFLSEMERTAKLDGLPDSIIYQQDPFRNIKK